MIDDINSWTDGPKFYLRDESIDSIQIPKSTSQGVTKFIGSEDQIIAFLNSMSCSERTTTHVYLSVDEKSFDKIEENKPKSSTLHFY